MSASPKHVHDWVECPGRHSVCRVCGSYYTPSPHSSAGVEAVLGMEMLDPEDGDGPSVEWCAGYNACLAVARSYLRGGAP